MKLYYGGREIIETNERVEGVSAKVIYGKFRAKRWLRSYPALTPFYHYKIEQIGFRKYEIVPYQNILSPDLYEEESSGGK